MIEITCVGSPHNIGLQHGKQAAELVHGTLSFYQAYFVRKSRMDWDAAREAARKFLPFLQENLPHLVEEMRGIAAGANLDFDSILALNVRTEISMGMMDDGCTSLAWKSADFSVAGQNWDWETEQKANVIMQHIIPAQPSSAGFPIIKISQATEAGLVGKIGFNSAGVGAFQNAIRAKGINFNGVPMHIAQRVALESPSRIKAVAKLRSLGFAASGHIMIADKTGATSLEYTPLDVVQLEMDTHGQIAHTNHFLAKHAAEIKDMVIFPDSPCRQSRVMQLLGEAATSKTPPKDGEQAFEALQGMLEDEGDSPAGINRIGRTHPDGRVSATLFSIVVDLNNGKGVFHLGRPNVPDKTILMQPSAL